MYLLPDDLAFCRTSQTCLWKRDQSFFWHCLLQYRTALHLEHMFGRETTIPQQEHSSDSRYFFISSLLTKDILCALDTSDADISVSVAKATTHACVIESNSFLRNAPLLTLIDVKMTKLVLGSYDNMSRRNSVGNSMGSRSRLLNERNEIGNPIFH
jgi:hypothetical protein